MSKKPQAQTPKGPDYTVYFIPERENARWIPIGAAWHHRDGQGLNLSLDLSPTTSGRIVLRSSNREGGDQ